MKKTLLGFLLLGVAGTLTSNAVEEDPNVELAPLFEQEGQERVQDVRPVGPQPRVRPVAPTAGNPNDYRFEPESVTRQITRDPALGNRVYVQSTAEPGITPKAVQVPMLTAAPEKKEAAAPDPGAMLQEGKLREVGQIALRTRDGPLSTALAWQLFTLNRWEDSRTWFERGLQWGAAPDESVYGLALSEYQLGNIREALSYARELAADHKDARAFLQDVLSVSATDTYDTGNYAATVSMLRELYQYRYLNRGEQLMLAWAYQRLGRHEDAASLFEALYRSSKDKDTADGLNAALLSLEDVEYRNYLARELQGPLMDYIEVTKLPPYTDRLVQRGFVRPAEAKKPNDYPEFQSVGAPVVYGEASFRYKSGEDGQGQLSETRLPTVGARIFLLERHRIEVKASRVVLTSGQPPYDADIGRPPVRDPDPEAPKPTSFPHKATTELSDYELLLRYRWEGLLSPYAEIGFPAGSSVTDPAFRLGLTSQYEGGYVEGELFGLPVRESILSYGGIRDPFTGEKWGRVREYGARFSVYHEMNERYSLFGQIIGSYMSGKKVQNNQRLAMRLSGDRRFEVEGMEYLTLGPGLSVANYRRNLSEFTFGHGGYFSPQTFFQGDINATIMTKQGQDWLVAASAFLGFQTNHQSSTPFFPKEPDGRFYPSKNNSSFVFGISGKGAVLLSPEWILSGHFSAASTADYTEYTLGMLLQYTFGHRIGLFGSDLSGWDSFWGN